MIHSPIARYLPLIALLLMFTSPLIAAEPELISVTKIWDDAPHSAFTDLVRFQDKFFCTFRESKAHVGGNGKIRILVSSDAEKWESAALISDDGVDLRDPKLSVTPDNRLMLLCGGSIYDDNKKLLGRQPRISFSPDGTTFSPPHRILSEGEWLWRLTWHDGRAYGFSYGPGSTLTLFSTPDGLHYDTVVKKLDVSGYPNESTLRFQADGTMIALVRRESGSKNGWIGTSPAPYTDWKWNEIPHRLGGPNFIILPSGAMYASGRAYGEKSTTILARFSPTTYDPVLTFPSSGDTSYPGLVFHNNLLYLSYYSSHEGKTSIYLAKLRLPEN